MKYAMLAEPSTIVLLSMGMLVLLSLLTLLGATIFLIVHFSHKSRKPASTSASPVAYATQITPRKLAIGAGVLILICLTVLLAIVRSKGDEGGGMLILIYLAVLAIVSIIVIQIKRAAEPGIFGFIFDKLQGKKTPVPTVTPATKITPRQCPQCGKALSPDVPEGLCPACLLQRGLGTEGGAPPGTPPFTPPTIHDLAGLFPQLEILELIGKGGMGAVYKARQPALDRLVALKILAPRAGGDPGFAERFTREARALARLSHPNIVAVHDFGTVGQASSLSPSENTGGKSETGKTPALHYFIMEFVDGPSLRQIEQAGRLSPREALEIIPQICGALQFAHDEGIVHRDIKPENVLLDKKGRVKIADFGLAKILGPEPTDFRLTGARDIVGTPHYMAPEQIEKPSEVDHRADIYSLGVVFYEMLTGELPLGRFQPPSKKVQVDVRLDEVVLHALEKEPARRYQHASEVKTRVETIASTAAPDIKKLFRSGPLIRPGLFTISNATPFSKFIFWSAWPIFGCYFFLLLNDHFNGTNQTLWHYFSYVFLSFAAICGVDTLLRIRRGLKVKTPTAAREMKVIGLTMLMAAGLAVLITVYFVVLPGCRKIQATRSGITFRAKELTASAETWSPTVAAGEKPDWQTILNSAKSLTDEGNYEGALQRYLWYFDHSRNEASQKGVRLSFALSDWIELGRRYPKAKQALIEIRDRNTREFAEGRGHFDSFMEVSSINHQLRYDDTTVALFKAVQQDKGLAQQCFILVEGLLVQRGDYELCMSYIGDPQAAFEGYHRNWERMKEMENQRAAMRQQQAERFREMAKTNSLYASLPTPFLSGPPNMADNNFVGQTCQLIEILVGTGRKADAEKIRDQAVMILDDPRLKSAISDAELKIQKHNAVQTVAEQPPVVVETWPASGGRDVKPGETEIRVRFSKEMADGAWSWSTAWENSAPEIIGQPHYEPDGRTCTAKVKLEPGRTYAWWLNSEKFRNFTDQAGRPAVPYLLIFQTKPN